MIREKVHENRKRRRDKKNDCSCRKKSSFPQLSIKQHNTGHKTMDKAFQTHTNARALWQFSSSFCSLFHLLLILHHPRPHELSRWKILYTHQNRSSRRNKNQVDQPLCVVAMTPGQKYTLHSTTGWQWEKWKSCGGRTTTTTLGGTCSRRRRMVAKKPEKFVGFFCCGGVVLPFSHCAAVGSLVWKFLWPKFL